MIPAITKVKGVNRFCSRPAQHGEQARSSFAGRARPIKGLLHRIGFAEPLLPYSELMHVTVFPTHGRLHYIMQLLQRQVRIEPGTVGGGFLLCRLHAR